MDQTNKQFALDIISHAKDMTLATIRPDGYPQATTVSYASDGLTLYVGVGKYSQKAENIRHCDKVSLTINADYQDWNHIKGVSMGARAEIMHDPKEIEYAGECMLRKFPQAAEWAQSQEKDAMIFLKITPQVISLLDYEKGFGHTELVKV
ncbi:pyridoxamine 5'-phosphate oxidase family protein [Herminiimonas sp. CN]|uniref:pyridoxamine 5'-phosphate oxidase family protein n=1 Tax=Herminiimonas sp. CN TaxID=1349818 RepID=UPI00047423F9|nr:pyridoxamine 5'-phosphate oxidase family protein [Herminiimonas sp. CN]